LRLISSWLVAATLLVALFGAACSHREKAPVERGQGIFLRSCAGCHGPNGKGTKPVGFTTPPRDLTDPRLHERLTDEALRDTITYGKGQMPPFGAALVPEDLNDLLLYVRSLRRGPR
jgi:mono/diheme cytochrome c family protein